MAQAVPRIVTAVSGIAPPGSQLDIPFAPMAVAVPENLLAADDTRCMPRNIGPERGSTMRSTLAVDDEVRPAAQHLAERDKRTIGDAISPLARKTYPAQNVRLCRYELESRSCRTATGRRR
jgi:hypothetical protein